MKPWGLMLIVLPSVAFAQAPDFHLLPTSPAIDAGICLPQVPTDFDGVKRPQGKGCDIGAYEFVPTNLPPAPPNNLKVIRYDGKLEFDQRQIVEREKELK